MKASPEAIDQYIKSAHKIVVLQADNPDADSLASALALEQILHKMGKEPILYCGVNVPSYLGYLPGWDRVVKDIPASFDASIIVDASADSLFESLDKAGQKGWVANKPCLIIDHHATTPTIQYASIIWNQTAVATGEVIYELAQELNWELTPAARELIASSILSDSLGLTSEATSARSVHIMAELIEAGVSIAKLENARRQYSRKTKEILSYKADLLKRVEYFASGRLASVTIPWAEIEKYSYQYNPAMLVLDEMRQVEAVEVAIAFKVYRDGKITGKIRCNYGSGIAQELAESFGGGGHKYASGFKITDGRPLEQIKQQTINTAAKLLDQVTRDKLKVNPNDEAI